MGDLSTVGDLTGHDIYTAEVEIQYGDSIIRGLLTELGHGATTYTMSGPVKEVTLRIGGVTVDHLPLNTPCIISRP